MNKFQLFNMKALRLNTIVKRLLPSIILLLVMTSLESCTEKIPFLTSSVVPAAEGWVKVKEDRNNNYTIELNVTRLADPQRLTPPKNMYVVWIDTEQNGQQMIGQLNMSKSLNGSIKTMTPHKPIGIFITAEDDINAKYPDSQVVLRTEFLTKF